MTRPLPLVAEREQDGSHHLRPEGNRSRRARQIAFLLEDEPLGRCPARPPGLDGPVRADPPPLRYRAHPADDILAPEVGTVPNLRPNLRRKVLRDERAHLLPEGPIRRRNLDPHHSHPTIRRGRLGNRNRHFKRVGAVFA